jgi:hypothetical protein
MKRLFIKYKRSSIPYRAMGASLKWKTRGFHLSGRVRNWTRVHCKRSGEILTWMGFSLRKQRWHGQQRLALTSAVGGGLKRVTMAGEGRKGVIEWLSAGLETKMFLGCERNIIIIWGQEHFRYLREACNLESNTVPLQERKKLNWLDLQGPKTKIFFRNFVFLR